MDRGRFFAGNVAATVIRLVLLSIVVGIVLSALDINPGNIVYRLRLFLRAIFDMGFGVIEWVVPYFLLGAIVVVPIWFLSRIIGAARGRPDDRG